MARVCAVSDPRETGGFEYARGLREAVSVALDYGLATFEGQARPGVPVLLLEQAKAAARNGVSLDAVLRRYLAGYTLLCDYLMSEAERDGESNDRDLRRALRAQGAQLDQLLAVVTEAYMTEVSDIQTTVEHRRLGLVRRLLAGELVDASDLGYGWDGWHLGVVAAGPCAARAIRELAALHDRRLLLVLPGGETAWGWLGGQSPLFARDLRPDSIPSLEHSSSISIAIGEPSDGIDGLRLTHLQARAALPIAAQTKGRLVRYADVAVASCAWGDDVLARSLSQIFLAPLAADREGSANLLKTLQAYFATGRNAASAAAQLGVSRQTVNSRLHAISDKIDRPLDRCGPELETALKLWELGHPTALAAGRGDNG
jgi:PucR-like helix-turn-helix protein/diguanylate cyclase with GGDEF domain